MVKTDRHPLTVSGEQRAFFGRRSGKRLHKGQDALYRDVLPGLSIALGEDRLDPSALFPHAQRHAIEIGYGGGEHLARQAGENPDTGFIGCEVFSGGIAKLLQAIDEKHLGNIRLFSDDALKLLDKLADASLDAAFLLYPDPWPKRRHHKRRFVSSTTLGELARVLKPGASLSIATDIEDYADWTLAHILRRPEFRFAPGHPGSWNEPYPGWVATRYEDKARRAGRLRSFYLSFTRR
jgi:tRNA (guanine-N7-)-methyltransferase